MMRQGSILAYLKPQVPITASTISELHPATSSSNAVEPDDKSVIGNAILSLSANTKESMLTHTTIAFPPTVCLNDPKAMVVCVQEAHIPRIRSITATLFPIRYSDKFFLECIDAQSDDLFAFVALYGGKVVGWIRCRRESHSNAKDEKRCQIYIQAIGVLAPYRSLGLASALLNSVIDAAKNQNRQYHSVYAHVWEFNNDALDWYEKRGFRRIILQPAYYRRLKPSGAWIVRKELMFLD